MLGSKLNAVDLIIAAKLKHDEGKAFIGCPLHAFKLSLRGSNRSDRATRTVALICFDSAILSYASSGR